MSNRQNRMLMLAPSIAIGVFVPAAALLEMRSGLDAIMGTIIVLAALLVAGGLGVVGLAMTTTAEQERGSSYETARTLRASQRAMLEEMDDVVALLEEIRDALKGPEGD